MAGVEVGDDGEEGHLALQALPLENPQRDVLHQRVHADDDVRLVLHQPRHHLAAQNQPTICIAAYRSIKIQNTFRTNVEARS